VVERELTICNEGDALLRFQVDQGYFLNLRGMLTRDVRSVGLVPSAKPRRTYRSVQRA
jgi:hypothetical protein